MLNQNVKERCKSVPQFGNLSVPNSNMSSFNSSLSVPPTMVTTARDVTTRSKNEGKKNILIIIYLLLLTFHTCRNLRICMKNILKHAILKPNLLLAIGFFNK